MEDSQESQLLTFILISAPGMVPQVIVARAEARLQAAVTARSLTLSTFTAAAATEPLVATAPGVSSSN